VESGLPRLIWIEVLLKSNLKIQMPFVIF
jgi:hypothetical protein